MVIYNKTIREQFFLGKDSDGSHCIAGITQLYAIHPRGLNPMHLRIS